MNYPKAALVGFSLALGLAGAVHGATVDGALGATSTGTQDVSVIIGDQVKLSGVSSIGLGSYAGSGNVTASDTMCVYRNSTGSYKVKLTSANQNAGAFRMQASGSFLAYAVDWTDGTPTTTSNVTSDVEISGQVGHSTAEDCGAVDNAQIDVTVAEAALQAAPSGSYSDTITILVTPT